jgi:hypothetical protein
VAEDDSPVAMNDDRRLALSLFLLRISVFVVMLSDPIMPQVSLPTSINWKGLALGLCLQ